MSIETDHLAKAQTIIASVKGQNLTLEERADKSVELAAEILKSALKHITSNEQAMQAQLARMMNDPVGKVFTTSMTDQCFRTKNSWRAANQLVYLLQKYGIPRFLDFKKRMGLHIFKTFGKICAPLFIPLTQLFVRKETSSVIIPGEPEALKKHLEVRREEGVRVNLNHLGEAILGEDEALHRLHIYLSDLAKPEVEYISVKISTICSQINLLAWEETLSILTKRLKRLYRAAKDNYYVKRDGTLVQKFVNLDMEEYRDLQLTLALFKRVLEDAEFYQHSAGIVLQAYLPDAYIIQQELTAWAMQRVASGGAPIKIRIVKGANLAMEQVEASLKGWPQTPYLTKAEVDANFKRMVTFAFEPERARAVHLGIGSHNLFDIAYALLLSRENEIEPYVTFEMLEGMADHMRRAVQELAGNMLLYSPAAKQEEFQNAVAYLVRRLDENTAPDNFLRHAFGLFPGSEDWNKQAELFKKSCKGMSKAGYLPQRTQNRLLAPAKCRECPLFENEPDTDWSLPQNRKWIENILREWFKRQHEAVPLMIGGQRIFPGKEAAIGQDPSFPDQVLYSYALADIVHIDQALIIAHKAQKKWGSTTPGERSQILKNIAELLRIKRGQLIGAMLADTGKVVSEGDVEVSEAIDFAEYYRKYLEELTYLKDIRWSPKGTVVVAPPWNFPCSIPAGGVLAALAAGNCVILKPAMESILVAWELVQIFWEAGVSYDVLQFIICEDEPLGSHLIKDPRVAAVILTGATSTAKLFMKMRPGLDLLAETGGKNAIIVTNLADRDLAVKEIVQSAFGHAGQKCSACSLLILEEEVYDDPLFRKQLKDAAVSLKVGSPWNLATKVNPLIRYPNPTLLRGLTKLDHGEEWLVKPLQDPDNVNLWSPGIKIGVKEGSFTHQNELFGPVLVVMRAAHLKEAMHLANGTPYGLTAGLHTLDDREKNEWIEGIEAGNLYINRGITGAIVQRQPFGGCKESSFGKGAKAGGPNYLMQLMQAEQIELPHEREQISPEFVLKKGNFSEIEQDVWHASVGSYLYYWKHYFSKRHDPSQVIGQDNFQMYTPHKQVLFRILMNDHPLDILRVIAACVICHTPLQVSGGKTSHALKTQFSQIVFIEEEEIDFIERISHEKIKRIRLLQEPSAILKLALAEAACNVNKDPVLANGRLELLNYLREVSLSMDYHRYGNLGDREGEERHPITTARSC